jgi:AAA domain
MADVPRPAWLAELIEVGRQLYEVSGGDKGLREGGRPKRLGRANRDPESDPGWFWVDPGGDAAEPDQVETAFLAPAEGPRERRFQVMEAVQDGHVLKVKVASFAPADGLFLWLPRHGSARSAKALLDGLTQISRFDLVDRLGQGRADPVPEAVPSGGLNADQARGLAACLAPGVQLVWGPPGTGKTTLIAAALGDLIARGQSVLLVSGTDAAVDDAVGLAAEALDPAPGVLVRAGLPHVPGIAADPRVGLQRMALDRLEALGRERADVEKQIATLRSHPDVARLDDAQGELAGFDAAAYREARRHIENASRLAGLRGHLRQLRERAAVSLVTLAAAQAEYYQARHAWQETAPARQHLRAATELDIELGNVARDCDRAIADVTRLEADRERIDSERRGRPGGIGSLARRRELKRLADHAADVDRRLDAARTRQREAERILASFSRQVNAQIEARLRAAEPVTHDAAARLRIAFSAAEKQFRHAWDAQQECIKQARAVDGQIEHAQRQPQPTAADFDAVAQADEDQRDRKLAGLPELEKQATHVRGEIERLEKRDEKLVSRLVQDGRTIRREIVRQAQVVAATLDMLRVAPELNERDYDHVLIDEAAAARLPEIVHAVSRATEGATLLGDFLQKGPVLPPDLEKSAEPAIQRWLHQDCFAIFGIHDPESAQTSPGCATLTQQGDP